MQRTVHVISKKIPKRLNEKTRNKLIEYSNTLTGRASSFKGFRNSTSFWKYETNCNPYNTVYSKNLSHTLYTISEWDCIECFREWKQSKEREEIHEKYDTYIENVTHSVLYKKIHYVDIPLL